MLYHLLYPLSEYSILFNLFRYITFRAIGAAVTAFLIGVIVGPWLIRVLKRRTIAEIIREDVPERHREKAGTPTMGGLLILVATVIPTLLWADLTNEYVLIVVGVTVALGLMGFWDDYLKVVKKKELGLLARYKFVGQFALALVIGAFVYFFPLENGMTSVVFFPFFKALAFNVGIFYIPFVMIVIVGSSNAINLTDGLDGLAAGATAFAALAFAVMAYVIGHVNFSDYLQLMFVFRAGELTIYCLAVIGATMGFLWFNAYPAQIFMGDTGSLALGGGLGTVAVMIKQELLLVIVGGVFVIESLSVIIQVLYFKLTGGKRVFRMAPIHHHYELKGMREPKIVVRFWILAAIFALIGLSTLKIR
jgi:phospho-N-acetylmuramoyl-pentapeptide-transferase